MAKKTSETGNKRKDKFMMWLLISLVLGATGAIFGFPLCCLPVTLIMAALTGMEYMKGE